MVCHEISHALTASESSLLYDCESGALNETLSDIMAVTTSRVKRGTSKRETLLLAEDVFVVDGGVRSISNPAAVSFGTDTYRQRYTEIYPDSALHEDAGIVDLAFSLMTTGGTHPRGKSTVVVPALDSAHLTRSIRIAASIFYGANVNCLTPKSGFVVARQCSIQAAEMLYPSAPAYRTSVANAWSAVGVTEEMESPVELTSGVTLPDQAVDASQKVKHYFLPGVQYCESVTCSTAGTVGDANLYVRTNGYAVASATSARNACASLQSDRTSSALRIP